MINKFGFLKDKKQQQQISNLISDNPSIKKQQFQAPLLPQPQPANLNKKHTYLNPQQYHPFQIPPNLHLASIHRKATQFGKINNQAILQAGQDLVCNCCMQHEKQQLAICCEGIEIYKVSESQGFYFEFIKVIVFALVMMFLVSGIDTMVSTERYCSKEVRKCIKIYRFFHVPQEISYDEVSDTILNILSAFFLYPFIFFLFYMKSKIHQKLMSTVIKMGDYSLMISGFDFQRITDKEIIQKLRPYSVESILFTHKIGDYLPTMQRRFILEAKKNLYFKRGYDEKYNKTLRQIYEIDNKILPFKNTMNVGNERQLRTDKIIVKFRTVQDKLIFIGEFHQSLCRRFVHVIQNKSSLEINQIPLYPQNLGQPQEIIWENLEVSSKYKFGVVLVNIVITFGILVISFIIIIQLTNLQNVNEQNDELFISFMIAFVIEIFNVALYLTISKMTQMERRITLTGKMMAKIIKNVCLFFFNTTLIPFSLFLLDKYSNDKTIVYEYIISLFFVNNLISPLSPLLNPFNLYKLYCIRKMRKQGKDCLFTQLQANQMYQKFNFQLQLKYQLLSQRILNSCFYAAFFPQVLILTIFGLILDYWIQKWWLLNYCCIPKFSARLGNVINQIALFFPTVYLFGYAANLLMLRGDKEVTFNTDVSIIVGFIILSLTISIIFLLFGKKWIEKYLKKHKPPSSIDQSISIKQLDYCDLNPTSFLHIDLQNQLNITHNFRNQQPQNNFSKIQQFVIKRKQKQLKRADQQRQIRISHLQNLYDSP